MNFMCPFLTYLIPNNPHGILNFYGCYENQIISKKYFSKSFFIKGKKKVKSSSTWYTISALGGGRTKP